VSGSIGWRWEVFNPETEQPTKFPELNPRLHRDGAKRHFISPALSLIEGFLKRSGCEYQMEESARPIIFGQNTSVPKIE
jgi:hypothetical protein